MTGLPERPISAPWLELREPADARAREAAAGLLPPLVDWLQGLDQRGSGMRIVDLGAGTGANLRWLAPRLPAPDRQHWLLLDHDPSLLARSLPANGLPANGLGHATTVQADVVDLTRVLREFGGADLITSAALLDLLTARQVTAIVEGVLAARVPALFSLSVTGEVRLDPPDPQDAALGAAFDAHQRRDGRLGPDAGSLVAGAFRDRGWLVLEAATPWLLDTPADAELIDAWLEGRAGAAIEQRSDLAPEAAGWLARRRGRLPGRLPAPLPGQPGRPLPGALQAAIGHTDMLALPAKLAVPTTDRSVNR